MPVIDPDGTLTLLELYFDHQLMLWTDQQALAAVPVRMVDSRFTAHATAQPGENC